MAVAVASSAGNGFDAKPLTTAMMGPVARRLDKTPRRQHPKFTPEPGFRGTWLPRLIIGGGLVIVVTVLFLAVRLGNSGEPDAPLDQAVESLFPAVGSLEPRQTQVTIDLEQSWTLESLIIDGVPIEFRDLDLGSCWLL